MNIGIHGKAVTPETREAVEIFFSELSKRSCEIFVSGEFAKSISSVSIQLPSYNIYDPKDDLSKLDVLFTLGGDGTLLEAVTHVKDKQVPLMGINTGRLGFLAYTAKDEIEVAIHKFFNGDFTYDDRSLLCLNDKDGLFSGLNFALNDFTIVKKDTSSMITVHTYLNGDFLNSYWADGIILSTPTGSTGYSLSCGGPLVVPQSNNFIITPVCPHNLTVRPIVVPDDSVISFRIEGRSDNYLVSLDSRFQPVDEESKLEIRKAPFKARLVKLPTSNYFKTLRQKLNWGLDVRN
ncbi:MAG: NAD kinase [Candidatus Cyclobacteriaceae bacterium M2_1C_046]